MCERTIDGASVGSGRRAFEADSWVVNVVSWDCRVRICVWRRVCKGFEGEVLVGVGGGMDGVAVDVEVDGWVAGGLVLLVFEMGGVLKGRVCAAVEGSCSNEFLVAGFWTELGAAWSAGTGKGEEGPWRG